MAKRSASPGRNSRPGRLRIVAGKWRSRLLPVGDDALLRPTSARVRETLFNWLAPVVEGAAVLDLFAGSGALGLEALSRGAKRAVFVERSKSTLRQLGDNIATLGGDHASLVESDATHYLHHYPPEPFDIVFLDPPYAADLYEELCRLLDEQGWLASGARIYLEQAENAPDPALPSGWAVLRDKTSGKVRYLLLQAPEKKQQRSNG